MRRQVLTYLAKNDIQANRNETEEEVENRVQAALAYEIEDANIAITRQHMNEMKMTDVQHLEPEDYLGSEQVDASKLAEGLYLERAGQLSRMKNPTFSKLYASSWIVAALAFMSRAAPHYNMHGVMTDTYLRTWLDVNMGVRDK